MNWSAKSAKSCMAASDSACSEQMRSESSRRARLVQPCETNWLATISVGRIPRFTPHTNPTPPDESDTTGQVFFQIRMNPTPPDHSDRTHLLHNPSVVGSIPTGPTRYSWASSDVRHFWMKFGGGVGILTVIRLAK
jgi:hypothetical protein